MHGGVARENVEETNLEALGCGLSNLEKHVANLKKFGLPVVVAINRFPTDDAVELELVEKRCKELGVRAAISEVVSKGGEGGRKLADTVLSALSEEKNEFAPLYDWHLPVKEKIGIIAQEIYGAEDVVYTPKADEDIRALTEMGYGSLPLCIAKTQHSLSDNPALKGAPTGWTLTVREVRASLGAGFLVPLTGEMMTMPGLPKEPAARRIDIGKDGTIVGLS
jgi:formate--tetrahydrofolate ligase